MITALEVNVSDFTVDLSIIYKRKEKKMVKDKRWTTFNYCKKKKEYNDCILWV